MTELQIVEKALLRYLVRYARYLQLQRILSHTNNMIEQPSQAEAEKLLSELAARPAYTIAEVPPDILRIIVLFECTKDTLIWPEQWDNIKKIIKAMDTDPKKRD